ncbi:SDR family NAD(P)-dependent oxidoreductase [Streptomyces sp. DSM 41524]|uniref:SDR family NAD(P)-dependent oxidoreductase n=1 Tax=Streptomyces asiaticus subsp. ignotus TaxID=3098222 RepID=A0ABU7QD54_9ACTN|nr:SDR family NAD(P)-dependent oxidoreductase [Streptomyces sp. DSM 41524]
MPDRSAPTPARGDGTAATAQEQDRAIKQMLLEKHEPIAVVGVGLRFPGGNETLDEFDAFLRDGRSGIVPLPDDRWDTEQFASDGADEPGSIQTAGGGFLKDIGRFDAQFFNISPKEAQYMDPQQRMLLETAWSALENANINPGPLRHGNGGVYIGTSSIDYALELDGLAYEDLDGHLASGITAFPLSGRLSYFLGWRGPSLSVDTACASSLTALHLAAQGLRSGECDIALCGAVNAIHHPRILVMFSHANMLAPDGQCKTFDEGADGYVRAEGCGVLVLKRLTDARRDGDTILSLVRGTAVGQDGDSAGLTVPNGSAQEAVMRAAIANAMLEPGDIQYVEAHGTGTQLGDPIEMGAISDVFAQSHTRDDPVVVGSVKTNLGHMEPAAGVVGVIKTILQMRSGTVYPHLNLTQPSGRIPWNSIPVRVPTQACPWRAPARRALVNSFGFAGGIAAAVLEEPPASLRSSAADPGAVRQSAGSVFTLSAKNARSLRRQAESYHRFLADHPDIDIADLCYTANVGRTHFGKRVAVAVHDRDHLLRFLDRLQKSETRSGRASDIRKVAFLFTGQGSQYAGMGTALYERHPVFRDYVDACDQLFAGPLGMSVRDLLLGRAADPEDIHQTLCTQPALFTYEFALAQLWISWGVRPNVLIGHSIGEVVAATVAGVFDLEDAVTLVTHRARLMQGVTEPGGMLVVTADAAEVEPLCAARPDLAIAAVNSPRQCVVSGGVESLARVEAELGQRGVESKRLSVSHAFHSPQMTTVYDEFRAALADITFHRPTMTLISNVTGEPARPRELMTVEYWVRHIGETVRFAQGISAVERRGRHAFVEIGPSSALISLARQCVSAEDHLWVPSASRKDPRGETVLRALAQMYAAGSPVAWSGFHAGARCRKITLPGYAFDRKHYWLPYSRPRHSVGAPVATTVAHHPLLGEETAPQQGVREFTARIGLGRQACLTGAPTVGERVLPVAAQVELVIALQDQVFGETGRVLRDVRLHEPLPLPDQDTVEIRTRLRDAHTAAAEVEISGIPGDGTGERRHLTARLVSAPTSGLAGELCAMAAGAGPATEVREAAEVYADLAMSGLECGPEYQRLTRIAVHGPGLVVGELQGQPTVPGEYLPPALLESALHCVTALDHEGIALLPAGFRQLRFHKKPRADALRVVVRVAETARPGAEVTADVVLLEGDQPVVEIHEVYFTRPTAAAAHRRDFFFRTEWLRSSLRAEPVARARHIVAVNRSDADFAALTDQLAEAGAELTCVSNVRDVTTALRTADVTDLWWFWRPTERKTSARSLRAECEINYRQLLELLDLLGHEGFGRNQRLWLVTEEAQLLPGDRGAVESQPAAASLWGFGHVLLNENPAYRVTLMDLPRGGGLPELLRESRNPDGGEFQVAFRGGQRRVRRLLPREPRIRPGTPFELAVRDEGRLSGIEPVAVADDPAPQGDWIQVEMRCAGLNFKDVLNALGVLRRAAEEAGTEYRPQPLGFEGSGTVVAAGPDAEFAVGEDVVVHHSGTMRRRVLVPSAAAVRKPRGLDFAAAAGLASAYVTAYYALHHLAGVKAGDRVLIHAAAGGVGQAAVRLAELAGAEVLATASRPKWSWLRAQGVDHVMDSRTVGYREEIARGSGSGSVDVVLNSLGGDHVAAGLDVLAPGGRFVELGTVDTWTPGRVRETRPDVAYHSFDLSLRQGAEGLRLGNEILRKVMALVEGGELPPITTTRYSLDEVEEAFSVLSRGANVGKLVLDLRVPGDVDTSRRAYDRSPVVTPDHTYLVTGGLGGLGLTTARELVDLGARHVCLVSRSGTPAAEAAELLATLREKADVTVYQADVSEPEEVRRLVDGLTEGPHPVGGIVHAAGALADMPVSAMDWDCLDRVFRSKVYGTWLLHEATAYLPDLRFFVCYSSAASVVGGVTQANYAAANAFMDNLMTRRRAEGLPGLSINWGPWAQVGMSARLGEQVLTSWQEQGIKLFTPARGMRALVSLIAPEQTSGQVVAGECDWDRFTVAKPVANALYERLVSAAEDGEGFDLDQLLTRPAGERVPAIEEFVQARVAQVLHIEDVEVIEPDIEFLQLGLDSLVAVELRNTLEAAFRLPLPASIVFDHPCTEQLAAYLDSQLTSGQPS